MISRRVRMNTGCRRIALMSMANSVTTSLNFAKVGLSFKTSRATHLNQRLSKPTHESRRQLSTSSWLRQAPANDGDESNNSRNVAKVIYFHNPIQAFANWIRLLSLKFQWDPQFNSTEFIDGARQAVIIVSSLVAKGDFDTLSQEGLLSSKAVEGLRNEVSSLDQVSRSLLQLSSDEIHVGFVQKVNMQSIVEHRYADIDVLFVGAKFRHEKDEQSSFANGGKKLGAVLIYISTRFHREYTEGLIPSWTITKLSYRIS